MSENAFLPLVERYASLGLAMIAIPPMTKAPKTLGWPDKGVKNYADAAKIFGPGKHNLGIVLGEKSGGTVDVDIDCDEARELAHMLPPTRAVFGRPSNPASHMVYRVEGPAPTIKFVDPLAPTNEAMILEIRGDGGVQTVFPPSTHPSGEPIEWAEFGEIACVSYGELLRAAGRIAAEVVIYRHGDKGREHPKVREWLGEPPAEPAGAPHAVADGNMPLSYQAAATATRPAGGGSPFFRRVNDAALANLSAWVPSLFPSAKYQAGTGAYRVSSKALGRRLQEDLSIAPNGIVDFGVADMGDPRAGKRTPIDLVMATGEASNVIDAARWLCARLGRAPEDFGWNNGEPPTTRLELVLPSGASCESSRLHVEPPAQTLPARDAILVNGVAIDAKTGEIIEGAEGAGGRFKYATVSAASLAGKAAPPQRWLIPSMIPERNVTMLYGDGATGKSLLALQLAVAAATEGNWIGFKPRACSVVYVSAEDEIDEVHRRLERMTPNLETLDRLEIFPLAGRDAILAAPEGRDGLLQETPLFQALRVIVETRRCDLLVLDTLADLFGGDEIKKVHARQFISILRGLAFDFNCTVVLLAHPSEAGMASGRGTSGNTAWNNSVRSRLYFERRLVKEAQKLIEGDSDIRVLSVKKNNRAPTGNEIVVRYRNGQFVRENSLDITIVDTASQARRVFLRLLRQFEKEGRDVSPNPSQNYAPTVFASHPDNESLGKRALQTAMNALLGAGEIEVETFGPPSRLRQRLRVAGGSGGEWQGDFQAHDGEEVGDE